MSAQHLAPLTWLRGCAAFFVVVHHCFYTAGVAYAPEDVPAYFTPLNFLDLGTFAVYLFFALSGCALTLGFKDKLAGPATIGAFYVQRWMRIWPVFAFSVLLYAAYRVFYKAYYTADLNFWVGQLARDYDLFSVLKCLSLTFNIFGPKTIFIGAYWSLPVEFQYYLLLPLALLLMNKIKSPWAFVVPVALGALMYFIYAKKLHGFNDASLFSRAYVFFGGVLAAFMYPYIHRRLPWQASLFVFVFLLLALGLVRHSFVTLPQTLLFISDEGNFDGVCAILMVWVGLLTRLPAHRSRMLRFLEHYGTISYSIYLFHYLFISAAALAVIYWHIFGGYQKFFFIVTVALVGSYGCASLTYRWIEKPSIALGRRWARRITSRG
jgi:peptidoglycan/LPS O-acetylase OafA/YrhL